jgi:hypothetical protein
MRVRAVDGDGDMRFGGDQASILRDSPDAVAQVVASRLHLWSGEWYLDLEEGTPYRTEVLGKRTEATRDPVVRARILDTPGVNEIRAYSSTLNRETRSLTIAATIDTAYGAARVRDTV